MTAPDALPPRANRAVSELARLNAEKAATIRRLCAELEVIATICEDALGGAIVDEAVDLPDPLARALRNVYDHATEALADPGAVKVAVTVEPESNEELRQVTA